MEELVATALAASGSAITATSLTDGLVFLSSLSIQFLAVRNWCLLVFFGVTSLWALMVTGGTAILTLDVRRQFANRLALAPCRKSGRATVDMSKNAEEEHQGVFLKYFQKIFLENTVTRIMVLIGFIALTGLSTWAIQDISTEYVVQDHTVDGSSVAR